MAMIPGTADVVVIGGGISGQACAASAARRGAHVVLLEKEPGPAAEASGRAQGSLRLQGREPAEFPLAKEAIDLWTAAGAEADAKHDFELDFGGNLYVCLNKAELAAVGGLVDDAHRCGLAGVRLLDPGDAREVMPALRGPFVAAMYSPVDGNCQPDKATAFYAHKAARAGVAQCYGVKAVRLVERGGRMAGVRTDAGTISAPAVVLAGGIWTPYLTRGVGVRVPVMPVWLSGAEAVGAPGLFRQTLRCFNVGARPRPDGRIAFSAGLNATVDHHLTLYDLHHFRLWAPRLRYHWRDVRLRPDVRRTLRQLRLRSTHAPELIGVASPVRPNDRALGTALAHLRRLVPDLGTAKITRSWTGAVDMSPDGMPILDGGAGPEGLTIVTGLSGHGLTLGPVIGEITADLALTGSTSRPIEPFRLRRFSEGKVPIPEKMI